MNMSKDGITQQLALAFANAGKELYLVGGTVRDELLGRESHDIDCCTNALPDEIKRIAAATHPLHIVPIGEKFGTIQVQYSGHSEPIVIEITTYRGERYQPGSRHPEVQFTSLLYEDLRRRDFTINAIAKDPLTDQIVDPFNGRQDLHDWTIRAVENPVQRFEDDPLRLLRAVRFAFQLDFGIEEMTGKAIIAQGKNITTISWERIRDELSKAFLMPYSRTRGRDPDAIIRLLREMELIDYILPEVNALCGVDQPPHHHLDVFNHTMLVFKHVPPRLTVRLAALLHDIGKPATKMLDEQGNAHFYEHEDVGAEMARTILRRLHFGNGIVEHVAKVVKLHMRVNQYTSQWSNGSVRRLFLDSGDTIDDLLDLAIADGASDRDEPHEQVEARINELRERIQQVQVQAVDHPIRSPLDGNELMTLFGRGPGSWLKPLKRHLNDLVIEGTLQPDDRAAAIGFARAFLVRNAQSV